MDVQRYSKVNKNMTFILVVVDVFSRYAYARGMKRKTAKSTADALKDILKENPGSDDLKDYYEIHPG